MRSHIGRPTTVLPRIHTPTRPQRGFSLIELLVTIVLAGIIFAAMVPFFANALSRTSEDELRVDATNIAQDRIEQIRLLGFDAITSGNLNNPTGPFGDDRFGHSYTLVGETRPYHIDYVVHPTPLPTSAQKYVEVSVSRPGSFVTTAHTIVQNPTAGGASWTDPEPEDLSLTVWFDNWTYVQSPGVYIRCVRTNVTPNETTTPTPASQMPLDASHQELTWTGLTGGPNYTYSVFCSSSKATYDLAAPPFRLWKSGRLKFDTYPGGD
jgi:prepilin-type N-terminal cleavage/methylation domain-containing protein